MTKQTRTVKWNLTDGREIVAEITIEREIITKKEVWIDQYVTVDCYELRCFEQIICLIDNKRVACVNKISNHVPKSTPKDIVGGIGRVGLTENSYSLVQGAYDSALVSAESDPKVVAYRKHEEVERKIERANCIEKPKGFGWCDKCGSYCFGDCEAN